MSLTDMEIQLKKTAAYLGILQGLIWSVLSSLCIILFIQTPFYLHPTSYMEQVNRIMYNFFLNRRNGIVFPKQKLRSLAFFVFMFVHLLLNLFWLISSVKVLTTNNNKIKMRSALKQWGYAAILICLLDLIMVILLGADYQACLDFAHSSLAKFQMEQICATGILPVLVIAARGFVLWIVNATFARVLLKIAQRLKEEAPLQNFPSISSQDSQFVAEPNRCPLYPQLPTATTSNSRDAPPPYQECDPEMTSAKY